MIGVRVQMQCRASNPLARRIERWSPLLVSSRRRSGIDFKFQCPKYLCFVRDLSFLPHLLRCQMSWHEVTLTQLTLALDIPPNDLDLALMQPGRLQPEKGTHPGSYRLDNNGALPTRMKFFDSTSTAAQDYRLRRCRRLLKGGPIYLQETKWKDPETEALYQGLPGVKIVHTPAVAFNERAAQVGLRFCSHLAGAGRSCTCQGQMCCCTGPGSHIQILCHLGLYPP